MTDETPQVHVSKREVLYRIPETDAVRVVRDEEYRALENETLTMDLYYPPQQARRSPHPAVVLVSGFPDAGYQRVMGCRFKEMGSSTSWGKLLAASGFIAVAYTNREPLSDAAALLQFIRRNAESLGIDEGRIGLFASSGNVPVALSLLMQERNHFLKCACFCYGYMLDRTGEAVVSEASAKWKFENPCAGKRVDDLPRHLPVFVARAGQDQMPRLNDTIDWFLADAMIHNLPVSFVNHHDAPHAFDLFDDSVATRASIQLLLAFMHAHLHDTSEAPVVRTK